MNGIKDTEDIRDVLQQAVEMTETDPLQAISRLEKLQSEADGFGDPRICADLYYALGSAYFDLHRSRKCVKNIMDALGYYRKLQDWEKLAQCYNVLGISYLYQGDSGGSIDAFSNELDLAENHGMLLAQMKAYINLASTCYEIGRYEDAVIYSGKAMELFEGNEDMTQAVNYLIVHLSLYSKAMALQGAVSEAEEALEKLDKLLENYPQFLDTPFERLPHFLLKLSKDHDHVDSVLLDSEMVMYMRPGVMIDYVYETIEFMGQLEKLGEYERLYQMLSVLDEALSPTDYFGYKLQQSRLRIDYCQHVRDKDALAAEIGIYCGYVDLQKEAISDAMVSYLRTRTSLKDTQNSNIRLRRSNRLLKKRANTDELTGLWNRRGLNEVSDQLFEHARRCEEPFGFEMMDIDFFKVVNDTYGHDIGDQCLQVVADVLREIQSDRVVYARYGGDEFVLIYLNHTDEEIRAEAERIRSRVKETATQRALPEFSVSQGICNTVPDEKLRLWDVSAAADAALYRVKETGRGSVRIEGRI